MSAQTSQVSAKPTTRPSRAALWSVIAAVVVIGAIGFDTKVVKIGSDADVRQQVFSPAAYGASEFPKVKASIEQRAVDAVEVGNALAADKAAAGKKYGVGSVNPVIPVKFTGTVEERKGQLQCGESGRYAGRHGDPRADGPGRQRHRAARCDG